MSYYVETNSGKPLLARSKLTGNLLQIRTIEDATRITKLAQRRSGQAIRVTRDPFPGEHCLEEASRRRTACRSEDQGIQRHHGAMKTVTARTAKTAKRHRCTECGRLGATVCKIDAGDHVHWFHPPCWNIVIRWLSGEDVSLGEDRRKKGSRCRYSA